MRRIPASLRRGFFASLGRKKLLRLFLMRNSPLRFLLLGVTVLFATGRMLAWDAEGHRIVNQLALAALPADFPAFVQTPSARERVAQLANVPDRWRNVDPWLRQTGGSWTDHYLDLEQLTDAGLDA